MKSTANIKCLVFLFLVQAAMFLVIQPTGDFPLNDDWAYTHSVEWLLSEGRIRLSGWIAPNLLPQTILGGLVSSIAGFSFEALRHLTQFMALLTSVAVFYWFRAGRLSPVDSLVASLVVISIPCWPVLANSYMTDIYGMFFAIVSATLFLRALERPSAALILTATVIACIGMLQRQVMLAIPFAFMLAWFWHHRRWTPRILIIGLLPFVATFLTELAYYQYLSSGPGVPHAQTVGNERLVPLFLQAVMGENDRRQAVLMNLLTLLSYLGLFSAAWAAWWRVSGDRRRSRLAWAVLLAAIGLATLAAGWLPPYLPNNTIDAAGIGPFTIYDGMPRELAPLDRQPGLLWPLAAAVAVFGTCSLLFAASRAALLILRGRNGADSRLVFTVVVIMAYLAPFLITGFFDRYLLLILPFVLLLWPQAWPEAEKPPVANFLRPAAVFLTAAVLILSSIATHDYFSWNRARWEAIRHAEALGAGPENIDGGFEYNGYYRHGKPGHEWEEGKSWWWVKDDEYVVTFSEVPGYAPVRTFPVNGYSGRTLTEIMLLRREQPLP